MKRLIYCLAFCLLPISNPNLLLLTCLFSRHFSPVPQCNCTACYLGVHFCGWSYF